MKGYLVGGAKGAPIGLILCGEKNREQIELLQLDRGEIRVAEYLVELPTQGDAGGQAARGHTAGERTGGERVRDPKGMPGLGSRPIGVMGCDLPDL